MLKDKMYINMKLAVVVESKQIYLLKHCPLVQFWSTATWVFLLYAFNTFQQINTFQYFIKNEKKVHKIKTILCRTTFIFILFLLFV